jgi:hypothetical protein
MGFNRRKLEDQRREAAEKEAATRRCLIASCCAGNVIARRISYAAGKRRGARKFGQGGRCGGSKAAKSKTPVISICVRFTPKSGHRLG